MTPSLRDQFARELPELAREGVRTRFIGRRDRANSELRAKIQHLEDETAANERLQLWIAFDYGGRAELVQATRRLVEEGVDPRDIDENAIAARLYAPGTAAAAAYAAVLAAIDRARREAVGLTSTTP